MIDTFHAKRPVYPLFGFFAALLIFAAGLATAKHVEGMWYLLAVWVWFLLFGYWRSCLIIIPCAAVVAGIFAGITYLSSRELGATLAAVSRSAAVCLAVLPGLSLPAVKLTRNLSQIHVPRSVTLGMMIVLSFAPLLGKEIKRIREAMRTRGAGSLLNPKVLYRALLVPFAARLVNISDTLSLSVETRGFRTGKVPYTIYHPVKLTARDVIFLLGLVAGSAAIIVLCFI